MPAASALWIVVVAQTLLYGLALRRGWWLRCRVRRLVRELERTQPHCDPPSDGGPGATDSGKAAVCVSDGKLDRKELALDLQLACQIEVNEVGAMARLGSWVGFAAAAGLLALDARGLQSWIAVGVALALGFAASMAARLALSRRLRAWRANKARVLAVLNTAE